MADVLSWVWYSLLRGVSGKARRALAERIGDPADILRASSRALRDCGLDEDELSALEDRDMTAAEQVIARCEELGVRILTVQDAVYPERLRNISDAPSVLYVKGRLPAVDCEAVIGVVGTRHASPYGIQMARTLGYGLAKGGAVVATGLAEGCDSAAAVGALMGGGRVIGVLGTAINEVYPAFNRQLFEDVAATGALVSEYAPGTPGNRRFFPMRNRIIAGLSLGVVVTEAPRGSGSLITARHALDYGRDVFAVPGNADAAGSRGSNELIQDGAKLCAKARDVLTEYARFFPDKLTLGDHRIPEERAVPETPVSDAPEKPPKTEIPKPKRLIENAPKLENQLSALSETQLKIVSAMNKPSMHIDDIIDLSGLPASTVLAEMTLLQIKGYVEQGSGKRFTLKITKRG